MINTNENLKPCPFCGGEAKFRNECHNDLLIACVKCTDCLASTYANSNSYHGRTLDELEEMVIKAWNRRANNG